MGIVANGNPSKRKGILATLCIKTSLTWDCKGIAADAANRKALDAGEHRFGGWMRPIEVQTEARGVSDSHAR